MKEVVFVGHTINESGHHFSKQKLDGVKLFVKPQIQKGLLGLANYPRDHVKDHSLIVRLLHQLIAKYAPNKITVWTGEAELAFEEIKKRIDESPLLFFLDDTSPIYLYTDASQLWGLICVRW